MTKRLFIILDLMHSGFLVVVSYVHIVAATVGIATIVTVSVYVAVIASTPLLPF